MDLGSEDLLHIQLGLREDGSVAQLTRGVEHAVQGAETPLRLLGTKRIASTSVTSARARNLGARPRSRTAWSGVPSDRRRRIG
jgi:hypothetical protein